MLQGLQEIIETAQATLLNLSDPGPDFGLGCGFGK
jgi:hypothetical protein